MRANELLVLFSLFIISTPAIAQVPTREVVESNDNSVRGGAETGSVPGHISYNQSLPDRPPIPEEVIPKPVPPPAENDYPDNNLAQNIRERNAGRMTQPWSKDLVMFLSLSILCFGLLVLLLMAYLVRQGMDADQILRVCALPLIIVAAIFLVVTGYASEQIAPVMGLLGAIAGYLLGSKRTDEPPSPRSHQPSSNKP